MNKAKGPVAQPDEVRLKRYLLGDLPDAGRESIEREMLGDDAVFEQLNALEELLVSEYVNDGLSPGDVALFEKQLATDPVLRRKVSQMKEVMAELRDTRSAAAGAALSLARTWLRHWTPPLRLAWGFGAVALVVVAWVGVENARLRRQNQDLALIADRQQGALAKLATAAPAVVTQAALSPGTFMGESRQRILRLLPGTKILRLRLTQPSTASQYRAIVYDDDRVEVWSGVADSPEFDIPAAGIPDGDYRLTLELATGGGRFESVADYSFAVARQ
jgi:hypothetical protein